MCVFLAFVLLYSALTALCSDPMSCQAVVKAGEFCYLAVQGAVLGVIADGKYRTGDLGGKAKCSEFTRAIIDYMK